jgi:tetratricopeptide (TPR) repeat protein
MDRADTDVDSLRKAVLNDPRNAELRYLLAAEYAQAGDYDSAVLEFSAAIALNPLLHVARFQLGLLHLTLGQPHHTTAVLAPLESLDDTAFLKHFKRGLESLIQDDFAASVKSLEKGIELNTTLPPLNKDMRLLLDKIHASIAEQKARPSPSEPVRTDFSLYGVTKH